MIEDRQMQSLLEDGVVRSERKRVVIFLSVLGLLLLLLAAFVTAPDTFGAAVAPDLRASLEKTAPRILGILLLLAGYEIFVLLRLREMIRKGVHPGTAFRYFQAAVEVSWVTLLIFLSIAHIGAIQTFSGMLPLLYFPAIALSALNLNLRLSVWSGVVAAAGFAVAAALSMPETLPVEGFPMLTSRHQFALKTIFILLAGLASGFVGGSLRQQLLATLRSRREKDLAVAIFGQHVSPQVAERLLNQPVHSFGEERAVCVMFLDIRDFSVFASEKTAGEVVEFLNLLFGGLIACVNEHKGIVNKFLGDGFMAVFGAPENDEELCKNAVLCARALLAEVDRLNKSGIIAPTRVGIGLHTGPAVTGIVGSEERREYTVIGDTVNLAARIEQATKQFHCPLLISQAVWEALPKGTFEAEDLGMVELKGQAKPARLFKIA